MESHEEEQYNVAARCAQDGISRSLIRYIHSGHGHLRGRFCSLLAYLCHLGALQTVSQVLCAGHCRLRRTTSPNLQAITKWSNGFQDPGLPQKQTIRVSLTLQIPPCGLTPLLISCILPLRLSWLSRLSWLPLRLSWLDPLRLSWLFWLCRGSRLYRHTRVSPFRAPFRASLRPVRRNRLASGNKGSSSALSPGTVSNHALHIRSEYLRSNPLYLGSYGCALGYCSCFDRGVSWCVWWLRYVRRVCCDCTQSVYGLVGGSEEAYGRAGFYKTWGLSMKFEEDSTARKFNVEGDSTARTAATNELRGGPTASAQSRINKPWPRPTTARTMHVSYTMLEPLEWPSSMRSRTFRDSIDDLRWRSAQCTLGCAASHIPNSPR